MPLPFNPWLALASNVGSGPTTQDSIQPEGSPIDALVGGAVMSGMSGWALPAEAGGEPLAADTSAAFTKQALAKDPVMLHRFTNRPELLSPDDWEYIELLEQQARSKK